MSKGKKSRSKAAAKASKSKLVKPDFMAQLKEVWGDRVFSDAEVKEMREFELEGEDG